MSKIRLGVYNLQVVCNLLSIYFDRPQLGYNKNNLHKTLDY